jgi:type I restriction enzyme R subunit
LGVAIREFPLEPGHGCADYVLYVQGKAAGVIEVKKTGSTLSGVQIQSTKYQCGLPPALPAWFRPLPFRCQSTGIEARFTNGFDPDPRSRNLFAFHRPDTLAGWLQASRPWSAVAPAMGRKAMAGPPLFAGCSKPCRR